MTEDSFQRAMREQPDDTTLRMVFADWLEEHGDLRGDLLRLTHALTQTTDYPGRPSCEARIQELLAAGVQPVGPRWTNSLNMHFVWVPAGAFLMGSPLRELDRCDNEALHPVTLTRGFYLGVHPVTQSQWQAVMEHNPSHFRGDQRPVECVSWEDALEFCRKLTQKDGLTAGLPSPYRLPTEAEWEYACRACMASPFHFGEALSTRLANYHANYAGGGLAGKFRQETTPVGSFPANAWGAADMHGNVWEWCADGFSIYPEGAIEDPFDEQMPEVRVLRGGSWNSLMARCRSACRAWVGPEYRAKDAGCRVCFRLDYNYSI